MMTVLDAFQCIQSRLEIATYMHFFIDFLMPSYCLVTKTTQELATALLMTYSYSKLAKRNAMHPALQIKQAVAYVH